MKEFSLSGGIGVDLNIKDFKEMLDTAGGDEINLSFSSVGGYVFDGFEIYNLIKDYKGKKSVTLNGITASIASYIAMAFDHITVRDNTPFMIHNAFGGTVGDYKIMKSYSEHLKNLTNLIADKYSDKTGKSKQEILSLMDKETWLYGSEIVNSGFADNFVETSSNNNKESAIQKASLIFNSFKPPARNDDLEKIAAMFDVENSIISKSLSNAKTLIRNGNFDDSSRWEFSSSDGNKSLGPNGDDWSNFALWHLWEDTESSPQTKDRYKYPYGKNGKVYRSALRAIASRSAQQNLQELSNTASSLLSLMDEQRRSSNKGARKVENKEDALKLLKNMKENGDTTLMEVANYMGLSNQVITNEHIQALEMVRELDKLGIKNCAEVKALQTLVNDTEEDRVDQKLRNEFDPDGLGEKNKLLTYAKKILGEIPENQLDEEIVKFKEDEIAKDFAVQLADYTSEVNMITTTEKNSDDFIKSQAVKL